MAYRLVSTISGKGAGAAQFTSTLRGVAVDARGRVYAVGDRAVKVFDDAGALLHAWKTDRPGYCITVQAQEPGEVVWVGESGQIERWDTQGKALDPLRDGERLGTVTAIGFSGGDVFVADATARCVRRYDRAGTWLNDIGKSNNTQGFVIPNGYLDLRVDAAGAVHVANPARHRIERYEVNGKLLGSFGKFGMHQPEDFGGCCNPTNLALMKDGRLVVTEKAPPRLKLYDAGGKVAVMLGPEAFDAQCKNMSIAVDAADRLYVVDTERLCIRVFAPTVNTTGGASDGPATSPAEGKS